MKNYIEQIASQVTFMIDLHGHSKRYKYIL